MNLSNNKILITGGASGIGLGLTERFLQENNTVLICGRRDSALQEVKSKYPLVITRVCDLEQPQDREALYNWIVAEHSDLSVLINNAGVQQWTSIGDDDFYSCAKQELAINVEAPVHLVHLFQKMKSLKTIINVTSGLSFSPLAKVAVYSATKAFFHSFTLSLRHLLKPQGIEVIEIIPPAINTDLGGKGLHDYAPPVSEFIQSVFEQLKDQKEEITFGVSALSVKATPDELKANFARMNGVN